MTVNEFINQYPRLSRAEVITFLQEHQQERLHSGVLGRAFEKLYIDQHNGLTDRNIPVTELCALHQSFNITNGSSWSRRDCGCYLGQKYILINHKENGRVVSICTNGYKLHEERPTTKRVSVGLLEQLKDAAESYKCLKGALSGDTSALDSKTIKDVEAAADEAALKMLHIIDDITKTHRV